MASPLTTVLLALIPSWLLVRYFHDRDLYPEPPRVVWGTFILGALVTIPIIVLVKPLMQIVPLPDSIFGSAVQYGFLYAAIPEEFFKLLVLRGYSFRRTEFDEPMDGIVYGAVAGQGFAALENALYSITFGLSATIFRAFTAVPAHACMGVIMGYYVGRARFEPQRRGQLVLTGYVLAVLFHGLYDSPLMMARTIIDRFGEVPDEYIELVLSGTLGSMAILVLGIVFARILWGKALRHQAEHPMPPPIPVASAPAIAHASPTLAAPASPPHPASIQSSPAVRAEVLSRTASTSRPISVLKLIAGLSLALFGGAVLYTCVHLFFGPDYRENNLVNIWFALVFLGIIPLRGGVTMFRNGIRELNGSS